MSRIYSVWNGPLKRYDYYSAPGTVPHTPAPRHLHKDGADVGVSPDAAAWPLPNDARMTGSGTTPRGTLAVVKSLAGLGDDSVGSNLTSIAIFGGAIWFAWKYVIKGKKT